MKKPLLRFFFALLSFITCLTYVNNCYGQNVTFAGITNGIPTSTAAGTAQVPVMGFSAAVSGGSITFTSFYFTSSGGNADAYLANGTLFRSPTGTFNPLNPGVPVGNVTFSGTNVTINNLSETISGTNYYFLVADAINTVVGNDVQMVVSYSSNWATDANGNSYQPKFSGNFHHLYTVATPYPLAIALQNTSLASPSAIITTGTSGIKFYEFSITNKSSSTYTLSTFNINSNTSSLGSTLNNFKLYSNTNSNAFPSTAAIATVPSTSTSYVTFNLSGETIAPGDTKYYWLVADAYAGATSNSIQFSLAAGQSGISSPTNPEVVSSSPSGTFNTATAYGNTYNINYTNLTVTSLTGGTTSGTITALQNAVVLFGFSVTSPTTISVSNFNINSTVSGGTLAAQDYFDTGVLYRCDNANYNSATNKVAVGKVTFNGSYANVVFNTPETITSSSANQNYFLVANNINTAASTNITFNFSSGQSTPAIVQASPTSNYNSFSIAGNQLTLPTPTIVYSANTTGYTAQTTFYAGQTAVLNAFNAKAVGDISVTSPYIDFTVSGGSPSVLFTDLTLWVSTTGSYADATQVTGTSFGNAGSGIKITLPASTPITISGGTTLSYYVVGTPKASTSLPTTRNIGAASIMSGNGGKSYTTTLGTVSSTLAVATITITGNNAASAGITQGALSYGQTNVVLFGFKMTAQGTFTMSKMSIPTTVSMSTFLSNGKIYRSTTPYFTDAQLLTTASVATVAFSSTSADISNFGQTFTVSSPTTYYYFLVADLVNSTAAGTTFQFNFTNGQTPAAINNGDSSGNKFNIFTTTDGVSFTIATTYKWTGAVSNEFTNPSNYKTLNDKTVTSIGSNVVLEIGYVSYTTAPNIGANLNVGGISFGTAVANPTLTMTSGKTLTINGSISAINGVNATISGSGNTITVNNTANSSVTGSSTLNLSNVALSNAGTFTVSANSFLNLSNNATIANTGTFTLQADANGSASIGALSGSSAFNGSYNVQQYVRGKASLNYRGYRLMSSPVSDPTQTAYYSLAYLKGSGSYLTGPSSATNGFDVDGLSTLYLYRQDITASTNYRSVTNINNPNLYEITTSDYATALPLPIGNGYLYFFRGNNSTSTTALPNDVVLPATGHLNQGPVTVTGWFYPISSASFQDATSLSYTSTSSTTVRGFNLVGNPYASTIDWNKAFDGSGGITASGISSIIYIYNPYTKTYATYDGSTGDTKDGGSRYIPSGQGFFVVATGSGAKLTFNETAKVNNQPGTFMLNSTPGMQVVKTLHVKLVKDSVQQEETLLSFNNRFSNKYVDNEDALYLKGYSNISFSSQSADKKLLAINHLPFPKNSQSVAMKVAVAQTGSYQLHFAQQDNIPAAYDIWLKDAFLKDSLDIRANSIYNFKVSADTNSTGAGRFSVVMRLNPKKIVHLLSFNANKSTNEVQVNWTTENEANYTTYILERSTDGGKTFKVIDSLTSAALGSYNDLDPSPVLGDNYYRLKQVDVAGNISYSNVIKVMYANAVNTILANSNISVYPNPAHSTINLTVTNAGNKNTVTSGSYKITITNSLGLLIKTETSASASWQGQIDNLLPGTYFVQVINTKDNTLTGKSTFIKL